MQISKDRYDDLLGQIEELTRQRTELVTQREGLRQDARGWGKVLDSIIENLHPTREYRWNMNGEASMVMPLPMRPSCMVPDHATDGERHDQTVERLNLRLIGLEGNLAAADAIARFAKANMG